MTDDRFPSDKAERIVTRLPDGMRERLQLAAKANRRSMNDEVVARLDASFEPVVADGDPDEAYLRRLMRETLDASLDGLLGDPERLRKLGLKREG